MSNDVIANFWAEFSGLEIHELHFNNTCTKILYMRWVAHGRLCVAGLIRSTTGLNKASVIFAPENPPVNGYVHVPFNHNKAGAHWAAVPYESGIALMAGFVNCTTPVAWDMIRSTTLMASVPEYRGIRDGHERVREGRYRSGHAAAAIRQMLTYQP